MYKTPNDKATEALNLAMSKAGLDASSVKIENYYEQNSWTDDYGYVITSENVELLERAEKWCIAWAHKNGETRAESMDRRTPGVKLIRTRCFSIGD